MTIDELIKWLEKEIPDINDKFPKCRAYEIALATLKAHKYGFKICANRDMTDMYEDWTPVETELDKILEEME